MGSFDGLVVIMGGVLIVIFLLTLLGAMVFVDAYFDRGGHILYRDEDED
jgi:hypothetical protein